MKNNLLKVALGATITAFGIYTYNFPPNAKESVTPVSKNEICMDYNEEQMSTLDTELIQDMVDNYRGNQLQTINSNLELNDARSVSFDLETLKNFLYHIENEAKKANNSTTDKQLGVRLYYAAYPDSTAWERHKDLSNVDKNYHRLHTLIMIPTIESNGKKIDFNPLDKTTFESGIPKITKGTNATKMLKSSAIYGLTGALNHGILIPPADPIVESF